MKRYWASIFALYAAWLTFWIVVGAFSAWRQGVASAFFIQASRQGDVIGMQVGDASSDLFASWIARVLMWGGIYPLPVLSALIVFGLVFRRIAQVR